MLTPLVINKNRELLPAQDYGLLRELGLSYISELSGAIWTDHNTHDPGITTLELLCYALTDLGYRTGFDTRDLLSGPDGTTGPAETSGLFPAHEVLTTAPLTIHDYRRLLLKIDGVRNAWMDPMTDPGQENNYRESEVPIYADCLTGTLSYEAVNKKGKDNPRVRLRGLYRVLLELEIDAALGSLNETRLVHRVRRGSMKGIVLGLDSADPAFAETDFEPNFTGVSEVVSVVPDGSRFVAEIVLDTDAGDVTLAHLDVSVINDRPRPGEDPVEVGPSEIESILSSGAADGIAALFWAKQQARKRSLDSVRCVLNAHRNLCEDFLSVETVRSEHVGVCADVEVTSDADLEDVQARVFHAIEEYLNPPIRYFTLKELLDEGFCADEIFNQPYVDPAFSCGGDLVFTKPGFVKLEDLESSELRRYVYTSDLINILMDLEGIVSVKNVQLRKYDGEGTPIGPSRRWCLEITPVHQPVLSVERSKMLFFKNEIPFRARQTEFQKTLDHLRAMAIKEAYVEPNQVFESIRGRYRNPDRFFSIQHDFPETYGIGEAGLPAAATELRIAQARQFKGYLTFFDQLLADYLAQLAGVRRLLSLDKTLEQTYFSHYLDDIAGVRDAFDDEFYVDKAALQNDLTRTRLTEDEELFQARRSRVLDHLTARFAEQFTDYALLMFDLDGDPLKTGKDLIDDKIDFLSEYPAVSRDRGRSFNYRPEDPVEIWDTENVAGLQKRVSRLIGIDDYTRRNLACSQLLNLLFEIVEAGDAFRVEVHDMDDTLLFQSVEVFPDEASVLAEIEKVYPFLRREDTYDVDASGGTGNVRFRLTAGGTSLEHDQSFDTEADAVQAIRALIDRYDEVLATKACDEEGFHLIEHILLRPRTEQDELMAVCLDPSCESCGDEDPYSFRIHVVLPYWPRRFRNLSFRRFFERTLREEAPAHVHARICWVSNEQMAEFDRRYREWLEAVASPDAAPAVQRDALRDLILILQRLKNVYPAATLHDCVEDENENPVRLGNTNLGIF